MEEICHDYELQQIRVDRSTLQKTLQKQKHSKLLTPRQSFLLTTLFAYLHSLKTTGSHLHIFVTMKGKFANIAIISL